MTQTHPIPLQNRRHNTSFYYNYQCKTCGKRSWPIWRYDPGIHLEKL